MTERRYTALFEPAEEGGFVAAREMINDAIRGYLNEVACMSQRAP